MSEEAQLYFNNVIHEWFISIHPVIFLYISTLSIDVNIDFAIEIIFILTSSIRERKILSDERLLKKNFEELGFNSFEILGLVPVGQSTIRSKTVT